MKLKGLFFIGLIFSSVLLKAQVDFRPGYIVKTPGDTIHGQIDYRGDMIMSNTCKFKDADGTINVYSPSDLAAFRFIDGKYFITREVNNRKVFLEYLINGKVSIYYMRDMRGDHYYIEKDTLQLTEMPYEEGIEYVDERVMYHSSRKHTGIMIYFMQDAPELQSRIQSLKKPEHEGLIKLANDYHDAVCKDKECVIYEKRLPLATFSVEPFMGLTRFNENTTGKFVFEPGVHLSIGIPRVNENIYFKTGVSFQTFTNLQAPERANVVKIPLQLQYIFKSHRIQPTLGAGLFMYQVHYFGSATGFYHRTQDYDYFDYINTFLISAGLNCKISDKISLCTGLISDTGLISYFVRPAQLLNNSDYDTGGLFLFYTIFAVFRIDL
jgi:hypothetical protein